MGSDKQRDSGAPQAPLASDQKRFSQPPKAGQKREMVIDVTDSPQAAPSPARPHHTRVKLLSAIRFQDGDTTISLPAGHEGEVPDSVVADPLLAHVFGEAAKPAPAMLPDSKDGGSPGFEPALASAIRASGY